ncbi:MAG: hypothetical protein H0T42_32860 [Deltaproteobacteria bacterium]|nr:hypothetical protein [Deltaproteobacteria bacterium]
MTTLSSTAWIAHNIGLAASIGGTLFGQQALRPALEERLGDEQERMLVADAAWRKFGWVNLAAHGLFAATWFVGRKMLSGYEVSPRARKMTLVKDGLIVASLVTGIASTIIGRILGKKTRQLEMRSSVEDQPSVDRLRKVVTGVGLVNLLSTASVIAVTTSLAMEGNRSLPFSIFSRRLP